MQGARIEGVRGVGADGGAKQAYAIGAVATTKALAAGSTDDDSKAFSVGGRRCGASRFGMPPGLWRVLFEGPGWGNVETVTTAGR